MHAIGAWLARLRSYCRHFGLQHWGLMLAIAAVIAVNSYALHASLRDMRTARGELETSFRVRIELARLMAGLARVTVAEERLSAGEGPDADALGNLRGGLKDLFAELATDLRTLTQDTVQRERMEKLESLLSARLGELRPLDSAAGNSGVTAWARASMAAGEIRRLVDAMDRSEEVQQAERKRLYIEAEYTTATTAAVFVVLLLSLLIALFYRMWSEIMQKASDAEGLEKKAKFLDEALKDQSRERQEATQLTEMSSYLQSCATLQEVAKVVPPYLRSAFPGLRSAIRQLDTSRSLLTALAETGGGAPVQPISPTDCWALRKGQVHSYQSGGHQPRCDHLGDSDGLQSMCVPMVAHGETIGLLTVAGSGGERCLEDSKDLGRAIARQISLTLAGLRLRETLHEQSVRDPLTGLYNRRYMNEILGKEVAMADRFGRPVSVLMVDIDHFKRFNDTWGHSAGDLVLSTVSALSASTVRETDWVFRYGGEELLILLADADATDAMDRAEALRRAVEALDLSSPRCNGCRVTVSIGVATYPDHGSSLDAVIARADAALYRAKELGRNRTVRAFVAGQDGEGDVALLLRSA